MENLNEKISLANFNFEKQNYDEAIRIYDELIEQNDENYVFYCNRSAAFFKIKKYDLSLKDALKAKSLNKDSIKAHYREGMALKALNKSLEAIVAFSKGLKIDENNAKILDTLLNTLVDTSFWKSIEPSLNQIKTIEPKLNSFLVLSLIGQHILKLNYFYESSVILNCCLKMNTVSQKLLSSVYSSIAVAYWKLKNYKYALNSMEKDLECCVSLNDFKGQFRALENLGSAYLKLENYDVSLNFYKKQLQLSKNNDNKEVILVSLNSLGNVYSKSNNLQDAILTFEEYLFLAKTTNNIENIINGLINLVDCNKKINDFGLAIKYQEEICNYFMKILYEPIDLKTIDKNLNKALLSLIDLGELYYLIKDYNQSSNRYHEALNLSIKNNLPSLQPIIYNKLANCELELSNILSAKNYFEKQFELINTNSYTLLNIDCLMNLANINLNMKNFKNAIDYYENLYFLLNDENNEKFIVLNKLADCYYKIDSFEKSIKLYKELLGIKNDNLIDRIQIMKNLICCYTKTNKLDDILKTYFDVLNYSKKIKNKKECLWSYFKIGCCYLMNNVYDQSILIFEEYLSMLNENIELEKESDDLKYKDNLNIIDKVLNILALINLKNKDYQASLNYFSKNKNLNICLDKLKKLTDFKILTDLNNINSLNSNGFIILNRLYCTLLHLEIKNEKYLKKYFEPCFTLNDEKVKENFDLIVDKILNETIESINCN